MAMSRTGELSALESELFEVELDELSALEVEELPVVEVSRPVDEGVAAEPIRLANPVEPTSPPQAVRPASPARRIGRMRMGGSS